MHRPIGATCLQDIGTHSVVRVQCFRLFVCLSVCLSVREHISGITTRPNFTKYFMRVTNRRGSVSSGGAAIRYVLPVLWTASCLPIGDVRKAYT